MSTVEKVAKYRAHTKVREALRKLWMYSPMRSLAKANARLSRGVYRCEKCKNEVGTNDLDIDHKVPAGSIAKDLSGLTEFAQRLLFGELQALCKSCHTQKTNAERSARASVKRKRNRKGLGKKR